LSLILFYFRVLKGTNYRIRAGDDDTEYWMFGESTLQALLTCQACLGLPETGVTDAPTWAALLGAGMRPRSVVDEDGSVSYDLNNSGGAAALEGVAELLGLEAAGDEDGQGPVSQAEEEVKAAAAGFAEGEAEDEVDRDEAFISPARSAEVTGSHFVVKLGLTGSFSAPLRCKGL
jgi:hypothetical protein